MANVRKDAVEVANFRTFFSQLRDWIDDDPSDLVAVARRDESIDALCGRLWWAADALETRERSRPALFTGPTDPAFIRDWRDYEARYAEPVGDVVWRWLHEQLDFGNSNTRVTTQADRQWDLADGIAEAASGGLEHALDFARDQISQEHREFPEDFVEEVEDGLKEWDRLRTEVGFDLRGVVRRRRLVPFVLVPRHVSARYGDDDKASMLSNLRAAHDAFVFGAPLAALAMMRSILEAVLRDHYGAEGRDLSERINTAQRLPKRAPRAALHRVRQRGNVVLHLGIEGAERLADLDVAGTEKEIVSLLGVLRSLIEEAPVRP